MKVDFCGDFCGVTAPKTAFPFLLVRSVNRIRRCGQAWNRQFPDQTISNWRYRNIKPSPQANKIGTLELPKWDKSAANLHFNSRGLAVDL